VTRISPLEFLLILYARRFPVRRGKVRLINTLWPMAAGGAGALRLAHLRFGGFKVSCNLNEMLQRQFYFFGTYFLEEDLLACWSQLAKSAATVFDVGANAGIYSLAALAANPSAVVEAFEPTPEIAERLRESARRNDLHQLHVHETAILETPSQATLHRWRGDDDSNEGMNFVTYGDGTDRGERVQADSLDNFCLTHHIARIDLMKIDIQGQEPAALRGAARLLRERRIDTIFIELNWAPAGTVSCPATQAVELLVAAGYQFALPGPLPLEGRSAGPWLRPIADVIALRPNIRSQVE